MRKIGISVVFVVLAAALSGSAQVKLNTNGYLSFDAVRGDPGLPATAWNLTHLRTGLIFTGEMAQGLSFALEPTFAPGESVGLTQAWAGLSFSEGIRLKAGLFLVPFGKYNQARRPYEITLISDPSPVGTAIPVNWREIGICGEAAFGSFNLALYAGNGLSEAEDIGAGQQYADNNRNKAWGGRLGINFSTALEVGGSYYRGKADSANSRAITCLGADASWSSENIRAAAEYFRTEIQNPSPFSKGKSEGWFATLEFRWGQWIPVGSYQYRRVNDPFHGPGFAGPDVPGAGISLDGTRWSLGLAYALGTNLLLKVEYDREREHGLSAWTSAIRGQAAVHF